MHNTMEKLREKPTFRKIRYYKIRNILSERTKDVSLHLH